MLQKDYYNNLNEKEKFYFQKIEYYSSEIPFMSITELSEKIYTSPASLSRLVKKLGYASFKEFKASFISENIYEFNGSLRSHLNKIIDIYPYVIDSCLLELLYSASDVYIVAFGNTVSIGQELAIALMNKNITVNRLFDSDFMHELKKNISKNDLILYISYSGMDIDMQQLALTHKHTNKQVLITSNSNSKLASHVSLIINSHTDSCNFPFTTRLPLELIVTIICMRLHKIEC